MTDKTQIDDAGAHYDQSIIDDVIAELVKAKKKHPGFPVDLIHGAAIQAEESGEVVQAALQVTYEGAMPSRVRKELVQTAAMCIRMIAAQDKHGWKND